MNPAKQYLIGKNTLAIVKDETVYTSCERGVYPLLNFLESDISVKGFSCADKVVGKGASFLYVLLEVKEVHACVLSTYAKQILERHSISVTYDTLVERIHNRDKTGFCPIEEAVMSISSPKEALYAIKNKLEFLRSIKV